MLCSLLYYTLILLLCRFGGVAQLGERLLCKQEVIGSIPFTSTRGTRGGQPSAIGSLSKADG